MKTDSINVCSNKPLPKLDAVLYSTDEFKYRLNLKFYEREGIPGEDDCYGDTYRIFDYSQRQGQIVFIIICSGIRKIFQIGLLPRNYKTEKGYLDAVVLCFTHAVIDRLKIDGIQARTVDSFFGMNETDEHYKVPDVKTYYYRRVWYDISGSLEEVRRIQTNKSRVYFPDIRR